MTSPSVLGVLVVGAVCWGAADTVATAPDHLLPSRVTIGGTRHLSGAQLDVIGPDGIVAAIATDQQGESAYAFGHARDGRFHKDASISTIWRGGQSIMRLNTATDRAGAQVDHLQMQLCGDRGVVFFAAGALQSAAQCPGAKTVTIRGTLVVEDLFVKRIHQAGR